MRYNNGLYICKTLRLMNYLCKKFDVKKMAKDIDNPNYSVFLFEDTKEFRDHLDKYNNGLNR